MLLLDDTSPVALAIDPRPPASREKLAEVMAARWPRLAGRIHLVTRTVADTTLCATDVVVSSHACGALTDEVLDAAIAARARVAVLPCCHEKATCDRGGVDGWIDPSLAIDVTRAARLRAAGYAIYTQLIPATITPKNRLLLAEPIATYGGSSASAS